MKQKITKKGNKIKVTVTVTFRSVIIANLSNSITDNFLVINDAL